MAKETITLDPEEVAVERTELEIHPATGHAAIMVTDDGPEWGDAEIAAFKAETERGEIPVDVRYPNRTVTIPLLVQSTESLSFDEARERLQQKVGLLQREGGWLRRTMSDGRNLYLDVVGATLKMGGGASQALRELDPKCELVLETLPDWFGDEEVSDLITETSTLDICEVLDVSSTDALVAGDYPGRVRIEVNDLQSERHRGLLWGFRSKHFSSASTAQLAYEAEALDPLDAAAVGTVSGASGGASDNAVVHANLGSEWTPVLGTSVAGVLAMTHVGTYRVWARVRTPSATEVRLRFIYDVGDITLPEANDSWTFPAANEWFRADLGEVRIDRTPIGTHQWRGQVQAKGAAGGETVQIDKVWFQPLDDGAGRLVAPVIAQPGLVEYAARDEFNHSSGNLATKTLPVGGVWSEAGDADAFTIDTTTKMVQRTAVSDTDYHYGVVTGGNGVAPSFVELQTASNEAASITSPAVQAGGNRAYIAVIDSRQGVGIGSVSGGGLTWTKQKEQFSGRGNHMLSVWTAFGSPSGAFTVTATQDDSVARFNVIAVVTYDGADPAAPFGAIVSYNTNGENGTFTGGVDDTTPTFTVTPTRNASRIVACVATRQVNPTHDADYTARGGLEDPVESGNAAAVWIADRSLATAAAETYTGSTPTAVDWATVGIVVQPSEAAAGIYSDVVVQSSFKLSAENAFAGVHARYTSTSSVLQAYVAPVTNQVIVRKVNTTGTQLAAVTVPDIVADTLYTIRLMVTSRGNVFVWFGKSGSVLPLVVTVTDSALATNGALQSGKVGLLDYQDGATAVTRSYDRFLVWVPAHDAVIFPLKTTEIRTEGMYRYGTNTAGGVGLVPEVIGDVPRIPPSALEDRPVELFLSWSRGDFNQIPDSGIDDVSARVYWRPSWLFAPAATPGS